MSGIVPPLSPEARVLLDEERASPAQPAVVRQRALARARAALTAYPDPSMPAPALARPHARRWFLVAATFTCAIAAAAGATTYELRARFAAEALPAARVVQPRAEVQPAAAPPAAPAAETTSPAPPGPRAVAPGLTRPAGRTLSSAEAAALELRILRPARAAVAREDFADALGPIAEHARRFKDGRLAEEREALRVKALAGLGRQDDARRAAAGFKVRFPRSVLLPAVSRLAQTGQ